MWEIVNRTRFAVDRTFARDCDGAEMLLVVAKATFSIGRDGRLSVAEAQVPVLHTPSFHGDPTSSSLRYDADFALVRERTDILLVGHAHTRGHQPSIGAEVRVRVGEWEKSIMVVGDRRWQPSLTGWALSDPAPFSTLPLVYERAFGGADAERMHPENPVGRGFGPGSDHVARGVPNLEDPTALLRSPEDEPRPMSLGPIARQWPTRRRFAGTFDELWREARRPLVPADFDDAFWQSAPADQQATVLGGESVELGGVSPRGAIRFELPRVELAFRTRLGGTNVDHAPALHTVLFEPDEERMVLVFQSSLACHHTLVTLERTTVEEIGSAP